MKVETELKIKEMNICRTFLNKKKVLRNFRPIFEELSKKSIATR